MLAPEYFDACEIAEQLSYAELVASLEVAIGMKHYLPERILHDMGKLWGTEARLLQMLAGREDYYFGFKLVSFYPENRNKGIPSLTGIYVLFSGRTGQPLAIFDGAELTARRTAATSMLATRALVKSCIQSVLIIGSGTLSRYFIEAYDEIFEPQQITLWARDAEKAKLAVQQVQLTVEKLDFSTDLDDVVKEADVISTLTSSLQPVLFGALCKPGAHIDLVGGYRPDMREADDDLMMRANIYVDTYEGALKEAGDLIIPLKNGVIDRSDIIHDLAELLAGKREEFKNEKDLTVFKSVGAAFEDLAAAIRVYEKKLGAVSGAVY